MKGKHPVCIYRLNPGDNGYEDQARYRVDTVNQTSFFFKECDLTNILCWMDQHGMVHVDVSEMIKLRKLIAMNDAYDDENEPWGP